MSNLVWFLNTIHFHLIFLSNDKRQWVHTLLKYNLFRIKLFENVIHFDCFFFPFFDLLKGHWWCRPSFKGHRKWKRPPEVPKKVIASSKSSIAVYRASGFFYSSIDFGWVFSNILTSWKVGKTPRRSLVI